MAAVRNDEETWADKQKKLKEDYQQTRFIEDLDEREKERREIEEKYFQVCWGEAQEDMMKKDYPHQLADIYVEASGTVGTRSGHRATTEENLLHSMRRAVTLSARLAYDQNEAVEGLKKATEATNKMIASQKKQTRWIAILTVVIAAFTAFQVFLRVVCG